MDFITITEDGEYITSKMPADETEVEVQLKDGSIVRAVYHCNIMEAGDYDFVPADDPDGNSLAADIVAWRNLG